jgi:hypothetical protein
LALRYTVLHGLERIGTGNGRIVDFSSSGVRFVSDNPLAPGIRAELSVDWPSAVDGRVQLQLVASGSVVWTRGTETALKILRHEFRTRGAGLKQRLAPGAGSPVWCGVGQRLQRTNVEKPEKDTAGAADQRK